MMDNGQQLGQVIAELDQEIGGASTPDAVLNVQYYVRENYGTEH